MISAGCIVIRSTWNLDLLNTQAMYDLIKNATF